MPTNKEIDDAISKTVVRGVALLAAVICNVGRPTGNVLKDAESFEEFLGAYLEEVYA